MDEETERRLREHVEQRMGRRISDDEWTIVKLRLLTAATRSPPVSHPRRGRIARAARSLAEGTAGVAVGLAAAFLVGALLVALWAGLAWAYSPATRVGAGRHRWFAGGALFIGWMVLSARNEWPRTMTVLLGIVEVGSVIAIAIGAILRAL